MAVRIRLKRLGRRHLPFYRIAVMDSRSPRDGRSIEDVGHYDPMISDKSQRVTLNMERIDYWISVGAKPSDKVAVLIDKVKKNRFGTASEPPPMTAPKEPPPPPEPAAEEAAPTDEAEDAAAADDDATADDHNSRLSRKHSVSTLPVLHPSDDNAISSVMDKASRKE